MAGKGLGYLCGGDFTPGPRDACPNELHDWPLPAGYGDAHEQAGQRLRNGWSQKRCPDCGLYGWRRGGETSNGDARVPAQKERGPSYAGGPVPSPNPSGDPASGG